MREEFLWTEKYRPKTVKETCLPDDLKETFQKFVDNKNIPNLLLTGGPGVGKTTIARAMLEELGCSYIVINGSMNGNIDTLRNDIKDFASSVSLVGGRKYVILDEADFLNKNSTQPALRNFMEEYSKNCGFILTCNHRNKIHTALQSRCSVIDFNFKKSIWPTIASQMFNRVRDILREENIAFDHQVVGDLVMAYFPDNRRIINELQRYSVNGKIDAGILATVNDESLNDLMINMKDKKFTEVRKWVGQNTDVDSARLFRLIYDNVYEYIEKASVPQLVLILADYQMKAAFVADQEINMTACLTEIMAECEFK